MRGAGEGWDWGPWSSRVATVQLEDEVLGLSGLVRELVHLQLRAWCGPGGRLRAGVEVWLMPRLRA